MEIIKTPEGGVRKATQGVWYQTFDSDGRIMEQQFVADNGEYEDHDGKPIISGDDRLNFYHPFVTEKGKHHCPQFTCKDCGGHRLEEIMTDVTLASEITDVGPGGDLEYASQGAGDSGDVDRYQCLDCGHVVTDSLGQKVTDSGGLALALGVDTGQADA